MGLSHLRIFNSSHLQNPFGHVRWDINGYWGSVHRHLGGGGHCSASCAGGQWTWPDKSFKSAEMGFLMECTVYYPECSQSPRRSCVFSTVHRLERCRYILGLSSLKLCLQSSIFLLTFVSLACVEKGMVGFLHRMWICEFLCLKFCPLLGCFEAYSLIRWHITICIFLVDWTIYHQIRELSSI